MNLGLVKRNEICFKNMKNVRKYMLLGQKQRHLQTSSNNEIKMRKEYSKVRPLLADKMVYKALRGSSSRGRRDCSNKKTMENDGIIVIAPVSVGVGGR